ncbi:tRNA (adenosine(37)-N6)-threonylcarbamoyltransferase complex transferase subunit TsaD [Candidatus Omnitrophota bacterium]
MNVMGIETSCDETAAAVVRDGRKVLSNVVASSLALHKRFGGVVPEIAFRKQLETITQVADSSLDRAGLNLKDIGLISVTSSPGLLGSLLVGLSFAEGVSLSRGIPLLPIDHLQGHIYAGFLNDEKIPFPFVSLVASGGHTSLYLVKDFSRIVPIGATRDDASGEAFDKVAKILGLGYPGGPPIERRARRGDPKLIRFACSNTPHPLDFSFSGIKTAVLYYCRDKKIKPLADKRISDVAASFQEAVVDTLVKKSLSACAKTKARHLVIGGGVAANQRLREKFHSGAALAGVKCHFPQKAYCMDNAAMIAGLGYRLFKKGYRGGSYA